MSTTKLIRSFCFLALVSLAACSSSNSDDADGGNGDRDGSVGDGGLSDGGVEADARPLVIGELGPGASTLSGFFAPGDLDGTRDVAMFDNPVNVLSLPDGSLLVCDFYNNAVRRITTDGNVSTLIPAGNFIRPFGIFRADDGTIYVQSDRSVNNTQNGALWKFTLAAPTPVLVKDQIGRIRGIAQMSDGRLVIVDYLRHHIRLFDPATGVETPLAGMIDQPAFADGVGQNARFNTPYDVVVDDNDVIYVADLNNNRIRTIQNGTVSTLSGDGVSRGVDGSLASARFARPKALALSGSDNTLYVTDTATGNIRTINLGAGTVSTIAGTGTPGFLDSENPLEAQFFGLEGIDLSPTEDFLYIADGNGGDDFDYHRVRRLTLE